MAAFARATGMSCADPPLWSHLGSNSIELGGPRWRCAAVASGIAPERFSASGRRQRTAAADSDYVTGRGFKAGGGMVRVS